MKRSPLETALRLKPRDLIRAEWQYRLAAAHFIAGHDELARDRGQTAATSNPACPGHRSMPPRCSGSGRK
jgi:hypothetical protein